MNWQTDVRSLSGSFAAALPPAMVDETPWDILLALHSSRRAEQGIDKLASILSVPLATLTRWLSLLEQRDLIAGEYVRPTAELRAVLTPVGRDMLDSYLSSASGLRLSASM